MQGKKPVFVKAAADSSAMALLVLALTGCRAGDSETPDTTLPSDAPAVAASATARNNPACQNINPFYWEIGDAAGVVVSGATGDGSITRTTSHGIASSTKWLFGAYVAEKRAGLLNATDIKHLTMSSGYTSFKVLSCVGLSQSATVEQCFNIGGNGTYTAAYDGSFFYNNGHFQKWAVDNGMGAMTTTDLTNEFNNVLGTEAVLSFSTLQLAGGAQGSAESYARFLVRVLKHELRIASLLGTNAVCTLPGRCASAVSSPLPDEFDYSLGHWVDSDPVTGDGSLSSAGLFGFYPWIDAAKSHYGIISRHALPGSGGDETGVAWASIQCGRLIRKAFVSGQTQ